MSHFRLISLTNFIYKIIFKILASKMKSLLHIIISSNQFAFLQGRSIYDNSILAHEIFHFMKKILRSTWRKLSTGWNGVFYFLFFAWIFTLFCFNKQLIQLVTQYISTVSFFYPHGWVSVQVFQFLKRIEARGSPIPFSFYPYCRSSL